MPKIIFVTKADGETEAFSPAKLKRSLKNAGATAAEVEDITDTISSQIVDGMPTESIYRSAFELLRASPQPLAARYSLRRALFGLGPTGFPFEDYLARLFEYEGYKTKTRTIAKGKCGIHELDVIAWKPDDCFIAEAKFHQQPGIKTDLQVILYTHARFNDLNGKSLHTRDEVKKRRSMVITNTKFTSAAIGYAKCAGVDLLSWDFPKKGNLQEWIERTKLYPVTVLSTISNKDKSALISNGAVLCSDIIDNHELLRSSGVPKSKIQAVMDEGVKLCLVK